MSIVNFKKQVIKQNFLLRYKERFVEKSTNLLTRLIMATAKSSDCVLNLLSDIVVFLLNLHYFSEVWTAPK